MLIKQHHNQLIIIIIMITTGGNTFCRRCRPKIAKPRSLICKFALDRRFDVEEKDYAVECLEDYLDDGGMVHGYVNLQNGCLLFSLNKHKRWMIADHISNLVERSDIQEEDFRLVLHERSVARQKCSSLTDITLRSYHSNISHDTISPEQKSLKWDYKDVMRGDVHPVTVPEIRYEITYPDNAKGPCKCPTNTDFRYRWETKIKSFGWKAKGNRNKSWSRWYYQGLDHKEHRLYCAGYRDDSDYVKDYLSDEEYFDDGNRISSVHPPRKQTRFTIKEFYRNDSGKSNASKKEKRKKKRLSSQQDGVEKILYTTIPRSASKGIPTKYGKGKIPNISTISGQGVIKWKFKDVKNGATSGLLGKDFDKSFCSCMVDKHSIERIKTSPNGHKMLIGNCVPQQLSLSVTGETTQALLLLWQKSEWSKWSFVAEYWLKVLLKPNTAGQMLLPTLLREELAVAGLFTVYELVNAARRVVNLVTTQQGHLEKSATKFQPGHLMALVSGARVNVKTIQEAYTTLSPVDTQSLADKKKKIWEMALTFDGGLLESYDLLPISLTQTSFGFCKACQRHFDPPLLKGCVLLPCLHYFCVVCWRKYIWKNFQEGCTTISCQDNTCNEVVDEVMIQTLMPYELFNQWLCSRADKTVASSRQWRQCPVPSCDKVAKVTKCGRRFSSSNAPVLCGCDRAWCYSCLSDVHWPATCDQYSVYRKTIEKEMFCEEDERLDCEGAHQKTCTIDQYNSFPRNSSVAYYSMCGEHRHKWTSQLYDLRSKLRLKVTRKIEWRGSWKKMRKTSRDVHKVVEKANLEKLESRLDFLRDVHFTMEAICLLLSHTNKQMRPPKVMTLLQRLHFCINTMTKMFNRRRLDEGDVQRMTRTQTNIEDTLKMFAVYVPLLEQRIKAKKVLCR